MSSNLSCSSESIEGVITDALPTLCGANIYFLYMLIPIATGKWNYQKPIHLIYLCAMACFCTFWSLLLITRLVPIQWLNFCYLPAVFYLTGWRCFDTVLMVRVYYISGKNKLLRNVLGFLIALEIVKDIVIYANVSCRYPNPDILIAGIWIVWPKINYIGRITSLIYHVAVFGALYHSVNSKINGLGTFSTIAILRRMLMTSGWRMVVIILAEIILNVLILTVKTKNDALIMFQDNVDMLLASLYFIEVFGYLGSRGGDHGQKTTARDVTVTKNKPNRSNSFMNSRNQAGADDPSVGQTPNI